MSSVRGLSEDTQELVRTVLFWWLLNSFTFIGGWYVIDFLR